MEKEQQSSQSKWAFYPIGIVLVLLLNLLAANTEEIILLYLKDFLVALAGLILLAGILWMGLRLIIKDTLRADLFTLLLLLILLVTGDAFYDLRDGARILFIKLTIKDISHFLILWGLLFTGLAALVWKLPAKILKATHEFLNIFVLLMLLPSIVSVGSYFMQHSGTAQASKHTKQASKIVAQQNLPDIYYIILDGYANGEVLKKYFNYDNNEFLNALEQRGFYVARQSTSNYSTTRVSIPSSLNLELLQKNLESWNTRGYAESLKFAQDKINHNFAMRYLKERGYTTVNFSSGWGMTAKLDAADMNIDCGQFNEFSHILLKKGITGLFIRNMNMDQRKRILCVFDTLTTLPKKEERKFVFAHIISPHPPFLFDKNGGPSEDTANLGETNWVPEFYLGQLEFINTKILSVVDQIQKDSRTPPIIIIQSDHGPHSVSGSTYDRQVKVRMPILNAYYVPPEMQKSLTQDITPVNSFRVIFNGLFNEHWEMLPQANYYVNKRLLMWDVTDLVKGQKNAAR